ncbi:MAG: LPS export ABC transporter periplasmic protein LptC [Alphaproteobacteria bacterium]
MSFDSGPSLDKTIHDIYRIKKYKKYFKYAVLLLIGLSIVGVWLWPYVEEIPLLFLNQKLLKGRLEIKNIDLKKKFIESAKYIGGGDRPYVLMADRAQQVGEDRVVLEHVQARITLKNGTILSVLAEGGDIQLKNQRHANLYGNVNIIYEKGETEISTQKLFVDMKEGFLDTTEPVEGLSLYGSFNAPQGIYIHQDKQFYKLKGPSHLTINRIQKDPA